tara:strand:+ start:215 stop:520 length:306 start_codon:yes stop_codon:yes gene_type:complete
MISNKQIYTKKQLVEHIVEILEGTSSAKNRKGDDPRFDAWLDEAINNITDADHKNFLYMFRNCMPHFTENKDDETIKDTDWYREFVDDQLVEEYESSVKKK